MLQDYLPKTQTRINACFDSSSLVGDQIFDTVRHNLVTQFFKYERDRCRSPRSWPTRDVHLVVKLVGDAAKVDVKTDFFSFTFVSTSYTTKVIG